MLNQAKNNFLKIKQDVQKASNSEQWNSSPKLLTIALYKSLLDGDFVTAEQLFNVPGDAVSVDTPLIMAL